MKLRSLLIIAGLVLLFVKMYSSEQTAQVVWGPACISEVLKTERIRMIAPLVDGKPDLKHATIEGLIVNYKPECGIIEIARTKEK